MQTPLVLLQLVKFSFFGSLAMVLSLLSPGATLCIQQSGKILVNKFFTKFH